MTIKGNSVLDHRHVKAVFGLKKLTTQNRSANDGFSQKCKSLDINYSHRNPRKALPYPERRHLTYFA